MDAVAVRRAKILPPLGETRVADVI